MLLILKEWITTGLPVLLSASAMFQVYLAGNLNKNAWLLASLNQCLWLFWILMSGSHGLILANLVVGVMYVINHRKWSKNPVIQKKNSLEAD